MIKHGYNDNMDLLPTPMSVAKIYFEIIKKNASEGVFESFMKAFSTARTKKKELRTKKDERRKSQKPEFFIIILKTRLSVNTF